MYVINFTVFYIWHLTLAQNNHARKWVHNQLGTFYVRQQYRQVLLRARISYGSSVRPSIRLSWCHDPVPSQAQVR